MRIKKILINKKKYTFFITKRQENFFEISCEESNGSSSDIPGRSAGDIIKEVSGQNNNSPDQEVWTIMQKAPGQNNNSPGQQAGAIPQMVSIKTNKNIFKVTLLAYNPLTNSITFEINNKLYSFKKISSNKLLLLQKNKEIFFSHEHKRKEYKNYDKIFIPAIQIQEAHDFLNKHLLNNTSQIKSPLTGRVVKIQVNIGDQVQFGQPLVIIESMKMENEISAHFSGIVKNIFVSVGNVVQQDEVLLEIEPKGEHNGSS
jgi:biotin carboxyl carrier protein